MKRMFSIVFLLLPILFLGCVSLDEKDPGKVMEKVDSLMKAGKGEEAYNLAFLAKSKWEGNHEVFLAWIKAGIRKALGDEHSMLGLFDALESECIERGKRFKESPEPYYALALVRKEKGDFKGAIGAWKEALKRMPFHRNTLKEMGFFLFSIGKEKEASTYFERLSRLPPNDPDAFYMLGVCKLVDIETKYKEAPRDLDGPERSFRDALEYAPNHVPALRGMSFLTVRKSVLLGRWKEEDLRREDGKEALRYLERALKASPGDPGILHDMAWIYEEMGENEKAFSFYTRSLEADGSYLPTLVDFSGFLENHYRKYPGKVRRMREKAMELTDDPVLLRALKRAGVKK